MIIESMRSAWTSYPLSLHAILSYGFNWVGGPFTDNRLKQALKVDLFMQNCFSEMENPTLWTLVPLLLVFLLGCSTYLLDFVFKKQEKKIINGVFVYTNMLIDFSYVTKIDV